ncbi:MAG TPA: VCBS repeat-containing protein, partial [Bryobacteraceae bacterium]
MFRTLLFFCAFAPLVLAQPIAFVSGGTIDFGSSQSCVRCIVTADFNGDGKADVAVNSMFSTDHNGVALGNGDGTFRPILPFAHPVNATSMSMGDFNGDGRPDLLFGGTSSSIEFGKGDGAFGDAIVIATCTGTATAGADFNRDGKSDLLCGMTPLLSNGDGTFRAMATVGNQATESPVLVTDLNGDGIPDIVIRQISSQITVALGNGDGTFGSEILANYAQKPQQYPAVLAGDFNGDGKVDLVTFSLHGNYAGDAIELLPGKGDGTFGAVIRTDLSASPASGDVTLAADFNQDGTLDLVGQNAVYGGNGDGTFRFPVLLPGVAAVAGNFNGDSMPDIVELDSTQDGESIRLMVNDGPGDGFWAPGVSSATG